MSLIGGCSIQPDRVTASRTSSGAPQLGQDDPPAGCAIRKYRRTWYPSGTVIWLSLRVVVDVHRLDADPAGPGHLRQVHAAAQQAGLDRHLYRLHGHRGVLVQESAGLHHDLLAGLEPPLE